MARRYDPDSINIGDEFFVSAPRPYHALYPSAAADRHGNVLIVWKENRHPQQAVSSAVLARALDGTGELGEVVTVHQRPCYTADAAAVAMNADGLAVIVWTRVEKETGRTSLVARRFTAAGASLDDAEQELETGVDGKHAHPSVGMDGRGDITVAWQTEVSPAQVLVCARRFAAGARPR
jgi:hypothetical protein